VPPSSPATRGIDALALDPDVLGANQPLVLVERGDDDPVVLDRVRQQLVKPVVNALDLERLPEVARGVEEQLSGLGLAPQIVLDLLVVRENVVRRLDGHVPNVALWGISEKRRRRQGLATGVQNLYLASRNSPS
jgi:hypothetical protein